MAVHPNDVFREIDYLEEELKRGLAKIASIRVMLASMKLEKPAVGEFVCPEAHCGLAFSSTQRLGEHRENVHGVLPYGPAKERV